MKIFTLIFSFIFLINCASTKFNFFANQNDIDSIIETVIDTQKLKALKSDSTSNRIANSIMKIDLEFKKFSQKDFEGYFLPIGPNGKRDFKAEKFIFKSDYKFFKSQNRENRITKISENLKKKFKNSNISEIKLDYKNRISYEYLEFSDIYFTQNQSIAYIEVNYQDGIYGDGTAYILQKRNGNWRIVRNWNLWIT